MTKLYFAYGSNLSVRAMKLRCPAAVKVGPMIATGLSLVFKGVADVIYKKDAECLGGLWQITDECEVALDRYEGVAAKLYSKRYFPVTDEATGTKYPCLYYKMRESGRMPPSEFYLDTIMEGYLDFGLDLDHLHDAVQRSWKHKRITSYLHGRRKRDGKRADRDTVAVVKEILASDDDAGVTNSQS